VILNSKNEINIPNENIPLGIIQLISLNMDDDNMDMMNGEIILGLLYDLLDFTKSPQATAFIHLFNCLDILYIF
jgi:hypothetical protein